MSKDVDKMIASGGVPYSPLISFFNLIDLKATIRAINIALVGEDLTRVAKLANYVLQKLGNTFAFDYLSPHVTLLQLYPYQKNKNNIN
jgi:hypothetical protein